MKRIGEIVIVFVVSFVLLAIFSALGIPWWLVIIIVSILLFIVGALVTRFLARELQDHGQ